MLVLIAGALAAAVVLAGLIWIIRDILHSAFSTTTKTIWIIVIIAAPVVGIIAWSLFIFRTDSRGQPRGRPTS
jgi:heme/copper-type cytochrome/quinol oxidase subunit 2